jgi:DNA ligase-4
VHHHPAQKIKAVLPPDLQIVLKGSSPYSLFRLLLPMADRERPVYGMAISKLIVQYIAVMIGKDKAAGEHPSAQRLKKYKDPIAFRGASPGAATQTCGDFPSVLEEVLHGRGVKGREDGIANTVSDVNLMLDVCSRATENHQREAVVRHMHRCYNANEQKWIVRIILKDMKIGLKEDRVLAYLHPDAVDMYNACSKLRDVCEKLKDPSTRYSQEIVPHQILSPMLAKRMPFTKIKESLAQAGNHGYAVEMKLDGERMLVHKTKDGKLSLLTRRGNDYTDLYASSVRHYLQNNIGVSVDNQETEYILDAEMLAWDSEAEMFVEFGHNKTVANEQSSGESRTRWMCLMVFDVLYIKGGDELEKIVQESHISRPKAGSVQGLPLYSRRQILEQIVTSVPKRIEVVKQKVLKGLAHDINGIETHFKTVMAMLDDVSKCQQEGLMLKDLEASYYFGEKSRNKGWVKIKPEYANMTDDIDLLVLGGYYGEGHRRSGMLSHFLLGIVKERPATFTAPPVDGSSAKMESSSVAASPGLQKPFQPSSYSGVPIYSTCKVGTGYTIEELKQLNEFLNPIKQKFSKKHPPKHMEKWKIGKNDDVPHFWFPPEKSVVFSVQCAEVTETDQFESQLTLRFPRVQTIRYDKAWCDVATMREMREMKKKGLVRKKVPAGEAGVGLQDGTGKKRRKIGGRGKQQVGISADHLLVDRSKVKVESSILEGEEIHVLNPAQRFYQVSDELKQAFPNSKYAKVTWTKQNVDSMILRLGGKITCNHTADTRYTLSAFGRDHMGLKGIVKADEKDVLNLDWLVECEREQFVVDPRHEHYWHMCSETAASMKAFVDKYGDYYTAPVTVERMSNIMKSMPDDSRMAKGTWQQLIRRHLPAQEEMSHFDCKWTLFWNAIVYVDRHILESGGDMETVPSSTVDALMPIELKLRLHGASLRTSLTKDVTHVVVCEADRSRIQMMEETRLEFMTTSSAYKSFRFVDGPWVDKCVKSGKQDVSESWAGEREQKTVGGRPCPPEM